MVRSRRMLEVIERDGLFDRVASLGSWFLTELQALGSRYPDLVSNARGRGLMCALDLPGTAERDALVTALREQEKVLLLPCGPRSIRFRPALSIQEDDLARGIKALDRCLGRLPVVSAGTKSRYPGKADHG
jgi:L-lysine 6-transaminase